MRLGELGNFKTGGTPARSCPQYLGDDYPWITTIALGKLFIDEHDSVASISKDGLVHSSTKLIKEYSLMIGIRVGVGKSSINRIPMCTNQDIVSIENINKNLYELPFLKYFLDSKVDYLESQSRGATIKGITIELLKNINLPDYPLSQQRHIAAILDKVTDLISIRKQQLTKFDELIKSRFVEMFGDTVRNPKRFEVKELSNYIIFMTSGSRGWSKYFSDSGQYFLTIKNVKNCNIDIDKIQYVLPPDSAETKRTKVEEGDLLISITADLGRTGVVSKKIADFGAYINQHLTCIRLNKKLLNPVFVAYFLESPSGVMQFNSKNQNAVKAGLNFEAIKSLKVFVPSIQIQNDFEKFINKIKKEKIKVQQSLKKLETLKASLMQEYFG